MDDARLADRMLEIGRLEQHVDERATVEAVLVEPLVEDVEDREQALLRSRPLVPRAGLDAPARPDLLAALEERDHELVLRREMPVERRLGDGRALDHLVDSDSADAAAGEELVGTLEDPLARRHARTALRSFRPSLPNHSRVDRQVCLVIDRPFYLLEEKRFVEPETPPVS